MSDQEASDVLLTVQEYANLTRVHPQTVYTAIRAGRFTLQVLRPTEHTIRIVVPLRHIQTLTHAE